MRVIKCLDLMYNIGMCVEEGYLCQSDNNLNTPSILEIIFYQDLEKQQI